MSFVVGVAGEVPLCGACLTSTALTRRLVHVRASLAGGGNGGVNKAKGKKGSKKSQPCHKFFGLSGKTYAAEIFANPFVCAVRSRWLPLLCPLGLPAPAPHFQGRELHQRPEM